MYLKYLTPFVSAPLRHRPQFYNDDEARKYTNK